MSLATGVEASTGHAAQVYTVAGLAALWGVSDQFIYDEIRRGKLNAMRFGGKLLRVRRDAVEEYEQRASLVVTDEPAEPTIHDLCQPPPSFSAGAARHGMRLERRARPAR